MPTHSLFVRILALCVLPLFWSACLGDTAGDAAGDAEGGKKRLRFAYITNVPADFWKIARAGTEKAKAEFDVDVTMIEPSSDSEQKQAVEDMVIRGLDGIAISPRNPANQVELINSAAAKMPLITQDSDAPTSNRLCFIGVDNYSAGRMCGKLVKKALPDGGKVALFVAWVDQDNARLRMQGTIDELMDRSDDSSRSDPVGKAVVGARYTVVGTFTDQADRSVAKSNAEDVMTKYPDINCMVGLYAYNVPMCLEALRGVGKLGKIKVVAFDENDDTLQAIKDGYVTGTIVQDPFRYGYESIKMLAALARGDQSVIPASKVLPVPARMIGIDEVDAFWIDLKQKLGRDE